MELKIEELSKKELKIAELESILRPYTAFWDQWKETKACFLTKKEIAAIECFRDNHNFSVAAENLELTVERVKAIFQRGKLKLSCYAKHYKEWIADKILNDAGVYDHLSQRERFLQTPIFQLGLSDRVRQMVHIFGHTMGDALMELDRKKFSNLRNIGKKAVSELDILFTEHGCSDLFHEE